MSDGLDDVVEEVIRFKLNPGDICGEHNEYVIEKEVAQGGRSVFYKAKIRKGETEVGLKVFLPKEEVSSVDATRASVGGDSIDDVFLSNKEIEVLTHLKIKKTARILGHFDIEQNNRTYKVVVQEFINGVTLEEKLKQGISFEKKMDYMKQIVKIAKMCHDKGWAHNDYGPRNIIVDDTGEEDELYVVDLTSAKKKGKSTAFIVKQKDGTEAKTLMGSRVYTAHERYALGDQDLRSDFWMLGGLFYKMHTGNIIFEDVLRYYFGYKRGRKGWRNDVESFVKTLDAEFQTQEAKDKFEKDYPELCDVPLEERFEELFRYEIFTNIKNESLAYTIDTCIGLNLDQRYDNCDKLLKHIDYVIRETQPPTDRKYVKPFEFKAVTITLYVTMTLITLLLGVVVNKLVKDNKQIKAALSTSITHEVTEYQQHETPEADSVTQPKPIEPTQEPQINDISLIEKISLDESQYQLSLRDDLLIDVAKDEMKRAFKDYNIFDAHQFRKQSKLDKLIHKFKNFSESILILKYNYKLYDQLMRLKFEREYEEIYEVAEKPPEDDTTKLTIEQTDKFDVATEQINQVEKATKWRNGLPVIDIPSWDELLGEDFDKLFLEVIEHSKELIFKKANKLYSSRPNDGITYLEEAVGKKITSPKICEHLAYWYIKRERQFRNPTAPDEIIKKLLGYKYINSNIYQNLGWTLLEKHKKEPSKGYRDYAIDVWEQARQKGETDDIIYFNLGLLHRNDGNIEKAKEIWEEAVEKKQTNQYTLCYLGIIYEKQDNLERAGEMWYYAFYANLENEDKYITNVLIDKFRKYEVDHPRDDSDEYLPDSGFSFSEFVLHSLENKAESNKNGFEIDYANDTDDWDYPEGVEPKGAE